MVKSGLVLLYWSFSLSCCIARINDGHNPFVPRHKIWRQGWMHRVFMLHTIYPIIRRLAGDDGNVLELGYKDYNSQDCVIANVSCDRWYFVDKDYKTEQFQEEARKEGHFTGHFTQSKFVNLGSEFNNKFRVVIDYGTIGFQGHRWKKIEVVNHTKTYLRILEPGGFLLIKFDVAEPMWKFLSIVRAQLSKNLVLMHRHAQLSESCPPEGATEFRYFDKELAGPHDSYDFEYNKHFSELAGKKCASTVYLQYYYPGDLYVG